MDAFNTFMSVMPKTSLTIFCEVLVTWALSERRNAFNFEVIFKRKYKFGWWFHKEFWSMKRFSITWWINRYQPLFILLLVYMDFHPCYKTLSFEVIFHASPPCHHSNVGSDPSSWYFWCLAYVSGALVTGVSLGTWCGPSSIHVMMWPIRFHLNYSRT